MQTRPIAVNDRGVCLSIFLSRGSTVLHCAKAAERIKILFGVNSPAGPWNSVLGGGPDPLPQRRKESWEKFWEPVEARKLCKRKSGFGAGSRDLLLATAPPAYLKNGYSCTATEWCVYALCVAHSMRDPIFYVHTRFCEDILIGGVDMPPKWNSTLLAVEFYFRF